MSIKIGEKVVHKEDLVRLIKNWTKLGSEHACARIALQKIAEILAQYGEGPDGMPLWAEINKVLGKYYANAEKGHEA